MMSNAEKARRLATAAELAIQQDYAAILAVGNGCVGTNSYGCFRYLVGSRVIYSLQAALFFREGPPIGLIESVISQREMQQNSTISDCRICKDIVGGIMEALEERGVSGGRLGTCLELLPAAWAARIRKHFPELELVDMSEELFRFRNHHSAEEVAQIRTSGKLADAGYAAVLGSIKAGMTEQQVVAEIDHATQKLGGDYNFTLISSGRYTLKHYGLPCIRAATMFNRMIQPGDSVSMEITPRYGGYWAQLVRTISVGEPSEDLVRMHQFHLGAIRAALPELYPGNEIGAIAVRLRQYIEDGGFVFALPCGHICGMDLNEERIAEDNHRPLEVGMAVILHPSIITPDIKTGLFWGETYLITEDGYQRLMDSDDELKVV